MLEDSQASHTQSAEKQARHSKQAAGFTGVMTGATAAATLAETASIAVAVTPVVIPVAGALALVGLGTWGVKLIISSSK